MDVFRKMNEPAEPLDPAGLKAFRLKRLKQLYFLISEYIAFDLAIVS